jgi:hypothetical protein
MLVSGLQRGGAENSSDYTPSPRVRGQTLQTDTNSSHLATRPRIKRDDRTDGSRTLLCASEKLRHFGR